MLTGDYRFDFEAVSDKTDITKIAQLGQKNIDLLLTETTNSERKGFSPSEVNVVAEIGRIVKNAKGRVFVSLFASNISRANELLEIAVKNNRKIVLLGRSMINNINASMEIKYVNVEKTDFVEDLDSIHNIPEDKIFVLMTGSQGEELAALNQIVNGTNKYFAFKPADTVVFSSSPIVGNYKNVENLINKLHKTRAKIIINSSKHPTHASGHATQQEQQLMVSLINPKYLLPVHGEIKMQHAFEKTAVSMGQAQNNILIVTNGQVVELLNHVAKVTNEIIPTFEVYIDGKTINDSTDILKYRKVLSTDGICGVTLIYNKETKKIINFPVFAIRGSFYVKTSIPLVEKMSKEIVATFDKEVSSNPSLNINNDYFSNLVKNVV
jgi:ribonuclease J